MDPVHLREARFCCSDCEQVSSAGIARGVAQLAHRTSFDLADSFPSQIEMLADFFECPRLTTIETETQFEDLALALVQWSQQSLDLLGEQSGRCHFEGTLRRSIFDDITEFGIAILTQRFAEGQGFGRETQSLCDLVLGHLDFFGEFAQRGLTTELELQA
jgi:hypothetical protein